MNMNEITLGGNRKAKRAYGFDEVSIVPGGYTVDPEDVNTEMNIGEYTFQVPILASAMDGVVDVKFAIAMGKLGGLAVLNLNGLQTRYDEPDEILEEISKKSADEVTEFIKQAYREPISEDLVGRRVEEIKKAGVVCSVSSVPADAERFGKIALEAGVDIFCIQSTVTSLKHESTRVKSVDIAKFCSEYPQPVIIGNSVTTRVALELMEAGAAALLIGIGPGAACTSRGVLGIGIPQITATADSALARDQYYEKTGRYVAIISDGGMRVGGDICKALASGADAVMIGSPFAKTVEAPGRGYHWGMATSHEALPRGTRVKVGTTCSVKNLIVGPALADDGSQNFLGSIKNCMGLCGARTIKEFQQAELAVSPTFLTEGKLLQTTQKVGMGR